jgi:adenine specific DNA methylase Mod
MIMNEIFGEENFVAIFPWKKRTAKSDVPFGVSQLIMNGFYHILKQIIVQE